MSLTADLLPLETELNKLSSKPEWRAVGLVLSLAIRQLDRIATALEKLDAEKKRETTKAAARDAQRAGRAPQPRTAVSDQGHQPARGGAR